MSLIDLIVGKGQGLIDFAEEYYVYILVGILLVFLYILGAFKFIGIG